MYRFKVFWQTFEQQSIWSHCLGHVGFLVGQSGRPNDRFEAFKTDRDKGRKLFNYFSIWCPLPELPDLVKFHHLGTMSKNFGYFERVRLVY